MKSNKDSFKCINVFFVILILCVDYGCVVEKGKIKLDVKKSSRPAVRASVSNIQIKDNQLVISGANLSSVKEIKIEGDSINESFTIDTVNSNQLVANSLKAITFDISKAFSLILSDANGSITLPINFSLCNSTLMGGILTCTPPQDKDVLVYDATDNKWITKAVNGLRYKGAWDANDPSEPSGADSGDYYIISHAKLPYSIGDWIVWNGSSYDRIDNSTLITSVFNRTGKIEAQKDDYRLNDLGDVQLTGPLQDGKVLKYDNGKWVAGDDLSGGGAGSVTSTEILDGAVVDSKIVSVSASKITGTISSAQITDGAILNTDISAIAAIDFSKINVPNLAIPYAKLTIADGDIPYAKLSGAPALTSILSATIVNGDLAHAPDGNSVFDALAGKLNLTGGQLTTGTIWGIPTPVNDDDVANKNYVDTSILNLQTGSGQWSISSNDIYYTAGKVGIGTNSPTQLLEIGSNTLRGTVRLTSGVSNSPPELSLNDMRAGGKNWVLSSGAIDGNSDFKITNSTNSVDRLVINSTSMEINSGIKLLGSTSGFVGLKPSAIAGTTNYTLPDADGAAGSVLSTNGSGLMSWSVIPAVPVSSVNTKTGAVVLTTDDISEGTNNLYYTNARVLGLTLTGYSIGGNTVIAAGDTVLGAFGKIQGQLSAVSTGKEDTVTAGSTSQYYRGDKSWQTLNTQAVAEHASNLYFTNARALGVSLTGLSVTNSIIDATDSVLSAFGKTQGQLNTIADGYVSKNGTNLLTGVSSIQGMTARLTVPTPVITDFNDATNVQYVQTAISDAVSANGIWSKSGSNLFYNSGNVGIGTSSNESSGSTGTNSSLQITKSANNTLGLIKTYSSNINHVSALSFGKSASNTIGTQSVTPAGQILGMISFDGVNSSSASTTGAVIYGLQDGAAGATNIPGVLSFYTGPSTSVASERMRIDSDGNIGIGQVAPSQKLSVADSISITNTTGIQYLLIGNQDSLGTNHPGILRAANGNFEFGSGSSWLGKGGTFTSKVMIGDNGRVGIGTTTPLVPLDVISNNASTNSVTVAQYLERKTSGTAANGMGVAKTYVLQDEGGTLIATNSIASTWVDATAANRYARMDFYSSKNNSQAIAMSIDQNGKVGVGTTAPNTLLDLGNTYYGGEPATLPDLINKISLWNVGAASNYGFGISNTALNITAGEVGSSIRFHTGGANERLRITGGGYVGIGTSSPYSKLHIYGYGIANGINLGERTDTAGTNSANIYLTNTGNGILSINNGKSSGSWGAIALQESGGSVGIGTTTPAAKLQILSNGSNDFSLLNNTAVTGRNWVINSENSGMFSVIDRTANKRRFLIEPTGEFKFVTSAGNVSVTIDDSGQVGIGTVIPSYTLHVAGSVAGSSAYVNTSDIRLKKNILAIPNALDKITSLDGIYYNWRVDQFPEMNFGSRRELGVIAQKVEKVFPEAVSKDNQGFRSVAYSMLIAPIIESIKELKLWLLGHDEKILALESENAKLKLYLCSKDPQAPFCKK